MSSLSSREIQVLKALEAGPRLDRYQLGSAASLTASELDHTVERLVSRGYLERSERDGIERFRVNQRTLNNLLVPATTA